MDVVNRVKRGAKAVVYSETLFTDLGFGYIGPLDGHDIPLLREVFRRLRTADRPVVVHVFTKKGKGYAYAENNPTAFHGITSFCVNDGQVEQQSSPSYTEHFARIIRDMGERDSKVVAITAAMAGGTGLSLFQETYPERFFDVGITEQHAVTFAAGLAAAGLKPVAAIYSTFMQRAVDQVIHDAALPNLGVTLVMDRAGLVGDDGETHQGLYDICLFRPVPNLTIMAPASGKELELMMNYAVEKGRPVLIRFPKAPCANIDPVLESPLEEGRGIFVRRGKGGILILSLGALLDQAGEAARILGGEGIEADVYNLRFVKPLDAEYLKSVLEEYETAYLIEDGAKSGGLGEQVGALVRKWNLRLAYSHGGVPDAFLPHGSRAELLGDCGLDAAGIAGALRKIAGQKHPL
jgi:1-deoxy-D-xylulose-5-phosphate synthase